MKGSKLEETWRCRVKGCKSRTGQAGTEDQAGTQPKRRSCEGLVFLKKTTTTTRTNNYTATTHHFFHTLPVSLSHTLWSLPSVLSVRGQKMPMLWSTAGGTLIFVEGANGFVIS